ncbi:MAG: hypothetical protein A3D65_02430 [Candidatus Lloydbacteria bacterium RIFCSPHIGHO2_02_FULL_50_13]|uniref:Uncharacterized protein n=1 Tax=Candidatus Lloydbacteria bacterium RIFCSPHIGHO2_02_FULL_50_13 TaxID=1798661 RepID=A0A1G2D750_9BACT|nr:MAG: hypothetical protein A3D65_02430 [Candidatus Lloydbacteria bacterium RIFCSPHIGHO2_02_FULL_50_13]
MYLLYQCFPCFLFERSAKLHKTGITLSFCIKCKQVKAFLAEFSPAVFRGINENMSANSRMAIYAKAPFTNNFLITH